MPRRTCPLLNRPLHSFDEEISITVVSLFPPAALKMNETDDPNSTACHRGKVCCSGKAMGRAKAQQERPDAPPKQKVASAMARVPRRDGTYQPQGQEEYLTDAIQQQKYLDILLPTTDIEDSSEILSRDEVVFVEKALYLLT